jgi:hypothetical protein
MVGATASEFRQIWPTISSWWIETPDHLLVNAELEERYSEARRAYEGRAAAARASTAKRKASIIAATRKSSDSVISNQKSGAIVEDEEL